MFSIVVTELVSHLSGLLNEGIRMVLLIVVTRLVSQTSGWLKA